MDQKWIRSGSEMDRKWIINEPKPIFLQSGAGIIPAQSHVGIPGSPGSTFGGSLLAYNAAVQQTTAAAIFGEKFKLFSLKSHSSKIFCKV